MKNMKDCANCGGPSYYKTCSIKCQRAISVERARQKKTIEILEDYVSKFSKIPTKEEFEYFRANRKKRTQILKCPVCYTILTNAPLRKVYCTEICASRARKQKLKNLNDEDFTKVFREKFNREPSWFEREFYLVKKYFREIPEEITSFEELRKVDYKKRLEERDRSIRSTKEVLEVAYPTWRSLSKVTRAILMERIPLKKVKDTSNLINLKDWYVSNNLEMSSNLKALLYVNGIKVEYAVQE